MILPDADLAKQLLSVDNDLLDSLLRNELHVLETKLRVTPYSRDFLFGRKPEHVTARNKVIGRLSNGEVTLLDAMTRRIDPGPLGPNIANSVFDLGSRNNIPDRSKTLVELARHVQEQRKLGKNARSRKDEFENIVRFVKRTFGRKYGDYDDIQNTLRVIHLLDEQMFLLGRQKPRRNLLSIIKLPTSRFSFETRSHHPTRVGEFNSNLLRDLRAYVGIEIDETTRYTIDSFFHVVLSRIDRLLEHLEDIGIPQKHKEFNDLFRGMEFIRPPNIRPPSRLDCDLYFHLHRIELLHFLGNLIDVLKKSKLPSEVNSIVREMSASLSKLEGVHITFQRIEIRQFPIKAVPLILESNAKTFLELTEAALGIRIRLGRHNDIFEKARELLFRELLASPHNTTPLGLLQTSFLQIVSAVCAVAQARKHRGKYPPKYVGEETQGGSIIEALAPRIDEINAGPAYVIPEAYLQFWRHRLERMQSALVGWEHLVTQKYEVRSTLFKAVERCLVARDFPEAMERYFAFECFIAEFDPKKHLSS